ncbi:MAG TPA: hypothetical protein VJC17_01715 [Candidatus Dojkabacteria bacterium]|nr:hypothetical protein [Candidatus Dojkabacteria bacterium]
MQGDNNPLTDLSVSEAKGQINAARNRRIAGGILFYSGLVLSALVLGPPEIQSFVPFLVVGGLIAGAWLTRNRRKSS